MASKQVTYMFMYQPNNAGSRTNPDSNLGDTVGICTLDDTPCGKFYESRGGASALSSHGFSFLYKTMENSGDQSVVDFPSNDPEVDFVDKSGFNSTVKDDVKIKVSSFTAHRFFMKLVQDWN